MAEIETLKNQIIDSVFSGLNSRQREAVYQVNGPVLVLAGAGSGKTSVLINRIANMLTFGNARLTNLTGQSCTEGELALLEKGAADGYFSLDPMEQAQIDHILSVNQPAPWQILAITFTNKAAAEMRARLEKTLGEEKAQDIWAGTFHWTCSRILRREIGALGYEQNFTIYDMADSLRVVKDSLKDCGISDKQFSPKMIQNQISRWKDSLVSPDEAVETCGADYRLQIASKVFVRYQNRLKMANALDFDDLIGKTVELFETYPDVLTHYQRRFPYILVDEYQDTNRAQYRLITLLAEAHKNLCVVGDDDQSIYKFRGATIENILNFEEDFPGAKVIRLEQNYRSTQNILSAANALISNNSQRKGKDLWTEQGDGEKILVDRSSNEGSEAAFIRETIQENVSEGMNYSDHAILYRMNAQSNMIERDFVRAGVPYRIIGGHRFYERKEIKDIMSYLAVLANPGDTVRLQRIVNEPKRGIGDATLTAAEQIAEGLGVPLFDVLRSASEYPLLQRKAKALESFTEFMEALIEEVDVVSLEDLYEDVLEQSGYRAMLEAQGHEGLTRLENIEELRTNILQYLKENPEGTLDGFLEEVSLFTEMDNYDAGADAVTMMTVHSAKGLEFPVVFIAGLEEGVFPGMQSSFDDAEVEEERRLAYVAITRAKKQLYITTTASRMMFGRTTRNRPSRFVLEIPPDYKETQDRTSPFERVENAPVQSNTPSLEEWKKSPPKTKAVPLDAEVGDRICHSVFGEGVILSAKPMGGDVLLEIAFDTGTTKKIMSNFAKIQKISK